MRRSTPIGILQVALSLVLAAGCAKKEAASSGQANAPRAARQAPARTETQASARKAERKTEGKAMTLKVTSSAFQPGQRIPKKYAYRGEGDNVSPPISWSGAPEGTKSFVLICEDPDAPSPRNPRPKPWVHWVLFNIPATTTSIPEGQSAGTPGKNDFGELTYGGPLPPPGSGTHRYFFKVYALDTTLNLPKGATRDQVLEAMKGHVLAQGEMYGTYER